MAQMDKELITVDKGQRRGARMQPGMDRGSNGAEIGKESKMENWRKQIEREKNPAAEAGPPQMDRDEAIARLDEIGSDITEMISEARDIAEAQGMDTSNLDAYVFEQILEHIDNSNPHNQSLRTIREEIEHLSDFDGGA